MTDTMVYSLTIVGVLIVVLGFLRLRHVSLQGLVLGLIGAILGLLLGALASAPLSKLPAPFGGILPIIVSVSLTLVFLGVVLSRRKAILGMLPFLKLQDSPAAQAPVAPAVPTKPRILVDTSVIIDGRIADIATAGFVPGDLAVPRFVLAELQNIADSDDAMRRGRGRRGLDVLNQLREMPDVKVDIIEDDVASIREVDAKLVALAQKFSCDVLTTDYNLNRVAQIQGVRVLNVNELSNAIRPVVLPGEQLMVRVVQPGKERNQGVGYLADGTMIVVENGDKLIGQEVATEVTRVFQTVAGKMIFATPKGKPMSGQVSQETPAPNDAKPAESKPQSDSPVAESDSAPRKNRFGRGRKRPSNGATSASSAPDTQNQPGNHSAPNPNSQRAQEAHTDKPVRTQSIENRIIEATSKPPQRPSSEHSN